MNKIHLKNIFLLVLILISYQCSKLKDNYSGFIFDENGKPLTGVLIRACESSGSKTFTDSSGFFKLKKSGDFFCDLILTKKGYQTDTIKTVWIQHGEKEMFSNFITEENSRWIMNRIVIRDSLLNSSDKKRFYDKDSVEMYRDNRLMYTQYLNTKTAEINYRYYDFDGKIKREVFNINIKKDLIHFQDFNQNTKEKNYAYLISFDSIPDLIKHDFGNYVQFGKLKQTQENVLLSETYFLWRTTSDFLEGNNEEIIGKKIFNKDENSYEIIKFTDDGQIQSLYDSAGKLKEYWVLKYLYGGLFPIFSVIYDSQENKLEEKNWENLYPKSGTSYNDVFSILTTQNFYKNGKIKSISKMKSYTESGEFRCGTWIYYNEKGKIQKTVNYGDCYNFKLEEENDDTLF